MREPGRSVAVARSVRVAAVVIVSIVSLACAGSGVSAPPPAPPTAGGNGSALPEPSPVVPEGTNLADVPTACVGLGEQDCRRVVAQVAMVLTSEDPPIGYVQVGPFGCPDGLGCPTTLAARSEGDVTLEFGGGAIGFHITAADGNLDVQRQETFGIQLAPSSRPPVLAGPQPFSLGHCGLWSGIDVGGSWWDPVGLIDYGHGDAINAAEGTIAPVGADRAVFTSKSGFTVQLARRDGPKFLPLCQ